MSTSNYELLAEKQNQQNKKKWYVEKNYAPNTVPQQNSTTQALYEQRKKRLNQLYSRKQQLHDELRESANKAMAEAAVEKGTKVANTQYYQQRVEDRKKRFVEYVQVPKNCSPYLNMFNFKGMGVEERMMAYNVRHKCSHGRCYTGYLMHESSKLDHLGAIVKIPVYIQPLCHCSTQRLTSEIEERHCGICSNRKLIKVCDNTFPGHIFYCKFCRNTLYNLWGVWSRIRTITTERPIDTVRTAGNTNLPDVWKVNDWANFRFDTIVEPEHRQATKQFGDIVVNWINDLKDKCLSTINGIIDWIANAFVDSVKNAVINKFWTPLQQILDSIFREIAKRPLTISYWFMKMFFTTSMTERMLLLLVIAEDAVMQNLIYRLVDLLGFRSALPLWKVRQINQEEIDDDWQDAVERRPATRQFGFELLNHMFGLYKLGKVGKLLIEEIKNFNTLMSGWKNLHELVNNFMQFLPDWLTKLFTITDPKKRYGKEAKTPGNRIYDMVQAYIALLQSCASPKAYEEFKAAWRAADEYILTDFTPSREVPLIHKQFMSNAMNIMTPGTRGGKPIPFVITVRGPPGTGKSTNWPLLLSGIMPNRDIEEIRGMSYTRDSASDHFDGYNPERHKIFVYDDLGSKVDDEGANELMAIVSNADFLPPYASVDNPGIGVKGTSFDSPIVVICTNFEKFVMCHQIAEPTALHRRLGHIVEWDERDLDARKVLRVAQPDGTSRVVSSNSADGKWTLEELQIVLAEEYQAHMLSQTTTFAAQNRRIVRQNVMNDDFLSLYHKASPVRSATKQSLLGFGFGLIVPFVYKWADNIDKRGRLILDCLAALALTIGTTTFIYYNFFSAEKQSGEISTAKNPTSTLFRRADGTRVATKQAGGQNEDGVIRKVTRSHVALVNERGEFVNGLFVKGRVLLTLKHFVERSREITVHTHRAEDSAIYTVQLIDCKVVKYTGADLALVSLPVQVQPYPDITGYFSDHGLTAKSTGYVTRRSMNNDLIIHETTCEPVRVILDFTSEEGTFYGLCDLSYRFKHQNGDCGNVLFAMQDGNLKIVGLHEAGDDNDAERSYATVVNRKEVLDYLSVFDSIEQIPRQLEFPHEKATKQNGIGVNKTQYLFHSDNHIVSPGKTSLRPSEIFDQVHQHTHIPAILTQTEEFDPMDKAIHKYGLSTEQFPEYATRIAVASLTEELMGHVSSEDIRRPLTMDECLNGIPGVVESVDTSTSSGYPFSLDVKTRGPKIQLLEGEPGNWSLGSAAQKHYDEWQHLLDSGIVPSDPFIATLKDEKRPIAKVLAGKTRVFMAGSITSFLHNKKHFGGFCAFLKRTRSKTFSTLGLDRSSLEWHRLILSFKEVSDCGLDGDQEEWDGRFKAAIALQLLDLFDAYYGIEQTIERRILFLQAIFCILRITWYDLGRMTTVLLEIPGCMPSGWFLTFVLNSLVNAVLMRIAWIMLISAPFNDLKYFRTYVREKYAGDDNFLAVSREFLQEFNNLTIAELFAKYGQKYTPASKTGELVPYQQIEDCAFLKLKTGRLFDKYVPLFSMDANLDTLNWIRKCADTEKATEDNCNDVLRNLFFYGEETFTEYRNKILSLKPLYNLVNFYALEASFLGYGKILDPTGAFGYSKNRTNNPVNFYKLVQDAQNSAGTPMIQIRETKARHVVF